jgi:hypothetical protein
MYFIKKYYKSFLFKPVRWLYYYYHTNMWHLPKRERDYWIKRIEIVLSCPDLIYITKDKNAGKVLKNKLIMHNGLIVNPLSYYGFPFLQMLKRSKGVHEPQEERIFQEVLKILPANSIMIELGSYWAFYSAWFMSKNRGGRAYMVEGNLDSLNNGVENFKLNNIVGDFTLGLIGKKTEKSVFPNLLTLDDFIINKKINFVQLLHVDIQGSELDMLIGAKTSFLAKQVGYVFLSTHSDSLHLECIEVLKSYGHEILFSIQQEDCYSEDGIIVSKSSQMQNLPFIDISYRSKQKTPFFNGHG